MRMGWIVKDKAQSTFALGRRQSQLETLTRHAEPFIRRPAWDVGETIHLAAFEEPQVFYCDKVDPPEGLSVASAIMNSMVRAVVAVSVSGPGFCIY